MISVKGTRKHKSKNMLEEPLCDDEYEYYTDEDEADIEDEASEEVIEDNLDFASSG